MRVATYRIGDRVEVGRVADDGIGVTPFELPAAQAARGVAALCDAASVPPPGRPARRLDDPAVVLLAPLPRPRRNLFCVGKNYHEHVAEIARAGFDTTGGGAKPPAAPVVFSKLPECVIAHGTAIRHDPRVTAQLDYEGELAVIIGRGGRAIPRERALEHVWGYTIVNDVTARDVQKRHTQWLLGKSQDGFCPMGPFAVTRDALDLAHTPIRTWVNGELRQDGNTGAMMNDVASLIATISAGITLYPGDVIATGTPSGVGAGFEPPRFLVAGDTVRIEIPPIGVLENPVAAWCD
ncbi:MAG: fumarylacetoacetate hydrolase family protein [Gammaproteobacteria bacterium]|nr:fumarylacetoacetate hydrolase family protein [Gammaproteobacteria bacterium]